MIYLVINASISQKQKLRWRYLKEVLSFLEGFSMHNWLLISRRTHLAEGSALLKKSVYKGQKETTKMPDTY